MARLVDADKLKLHYAWWGSVDNYTSDTMTYPEAKAIVDTIIDLQPTIEAKPSKLREVIEPYREFCEWVAEEIFGDEGDYWENVKDAFPELACRRLHKLGIVHKEGDKWLWADRKELEDG